VRAGALAAVLLALLPAFPAARMAASDAADAEPAADVESTAGAESSADDGPRIEALWSAPLAVDEVGLVRLDATDEGLLVTLHDRRSLRCVEMRSVSSGELLWRRLPGDADAATTPAGTHAASGDTDGDGRDELLVVEELNELVCRDEDGTERWRLVLGEKGRLRPTGVASCDPVVADVTGDRLPDVVVGCFAGAVVVVDGELGEELTRLQFGNESHERHIRNRRLSTFIREALLSTGEPIAEILAVELDGVSGEELVFGCSDGHVYAVSPRSGRTLWRFAPARDVYDRPVVEPGAETPVRRRLVVWNEERAHILDVATGEELAALARPRINAGVVLGWGDGHVDLAVVDGLTRVVEAWRVPTGE